MKTPQSKQDLLPAVLFLSGLGAGIIVINFIVVRLVGFPLSGWFPLGMRCISVLGGLVLSASAGLILRYVRPKPNKLIISVLITLSALGVVAYGITCAEGDWPQTGQIMVASIVFGYVLMPFVSSHQNDALEHLLLSCSFSCMFAVTGLLEEYQAIRVIPAVAFVYEVVRLSYSDFIRRSMRPRWVRGLLVCLCGGSFLLSLRFIYLGVYYKVTGQLINLIVQPVFIWLVYQLVKWVQPADKDISIEAKADSR